jgi:hypothetical protein
VQGWQHAGDQGGQDLRAHSTLGSAHKPAQLQMLFDPFEEQLDLPTSFVEVRDITLGRTLRCRVFQMVATGPIWVEPTLPQLEGDWHPCTAQTLSAPSDPGCQIAWCNGRPGARARSDRTVGGVCPSEGMERTHPEHVARLGLMSPCSGFYPQRKPRNVFGSACQFPPGSSAIARE